MISLAKKIKIFPLILQNVKLTTFEKFFEKIYKKGLTF